MTDPEKKAEKKTLGQSNPEEIKEKVEEAIKEALQSKLASPEEKREAQLLENFEIQLESHIKKPSSSNSSPSYFWRQWADIFYGVLIAPQQTMNILCDATLFPPNQANRTGALLILGLALALACAGQIEQGGATGFFTSFFAGLTSWIYLSTTLYYFCHGKGTEKITFTSAAIAIAWSYLPFLFSGIGACYKGLLGQYAVLATVLLALWFIVLVFNVFKSALKISHRRLTLMAFTLPPILVLSLSFWLLALLFFLLFACPN